jgi:hypothetical protein
MHSGTLTNAYATGTVSGNSNSSMLGGLVGWMSSGSITNAYATGAVSGNGYYIGGLVGWTWDATITNAYATGDVTDNAFGSVDGGQILGGLVGYEYGGSITNAYATGSVSGGLHAYLVGGLVGYKYGGSITNAFAAGSVSGGLNSSPSPALGGLVGGLYSGSITNTFWHIDKNRQWLGEGSGSSSGVTGLTTAQMQDLSSFQTTYTGWDFQNVWAPPNQVGQGGQTTANYPTLYALTPVLWNVSDNITMTYGASVPAVSSSATYGGTASYVFGRTGDSLSAPSLTTTATSTSNVGNYTTAKTATSADGIIYRVLSTGSVDVTARPITVTADAQTQSYGSAIPTLTYSVGGGGLVNGDSFSGSLGTTATPTANVGVYAITQNTLANANYSITFTGANDVVTVRPVTVTALGGTSSLGSSPPNPGLSATGLQNGQDVSVLTGLFNDFGITSASAVGSYATSVGGTLTNTNYAVVSIVEGQWIVSPMPITQFSSSTILPSMKDVAPQMISPAASTAAFDPAAMDFSSGSETLFFKDPRWE